MGKQILREASEGGFCPNFVILMEAELPSGPSDCFKGPNQLSMPITGFFLNADK